MNDLKIPELPEQYKFHQGKNSFWITDNTYDQLPTSNEAKVAWSYFDITMRLLMARPGRTPATYAEDFNTLQEALDVAAARLWLGMFD